MATNFYECMLSCRACSNSLTTVLTQFHSDPLTIHAMTNDSMDLGLTENELNVLFNGYAACWAVARFERFATSTA
jgi:predicted nucleic acid-binding Zn ribbon protein